MLRVKDGPKSVAFYRDHLGMTCIRAMDLPQYKFRRGGASRSIALHAHLTVGPPCRMLQNPKPLLMPSDGPSAS